MQARLSATGKGAALLLVAGGAAAAALAASLSAFRAASATRTSLVAAPRSGCCSCSLASSGLKPRSGSATRSPRTASKRASGVQGSHMRGAPARSAAGPAAGCRGHRMSRRTASPSLRKGHRAANGPDFKVVTNKSNLITTGAAPTVQAFLSALPASRQLLNSAPEKPSTCRFFWPNMSSPSSVYSPCNRLGHLKQCLTRT
eukprot:scaffold48662_cov49-Phaeocystis_antarctica.AAC.2